MLFFLTSSLREMFDRGLLVSFTQKLYLELKSNIYPLLQRRPSKIIAPLSGFHWFLTSGQGLHAHALIGWRSRVR